MSVSSTMVFYSVTYSCEEMTQIEDRILHPEKSEPLLYIYLVSRGSIDEYAVELVRNKMLTAKQFMSKLHEQFLQQRSKV